MTFRDAPAGWRRQVIIRGVSDHDKPAGATGGTEASSCAARPGPSGKAPYTSVSCYLLLLT